MSTPDTRTVHALRAGLPLCQFTTDVPVDWPNGHTWTYIEDAEHITCPDCKIRAAEMLAHRYVRRT